MTEAYKIIDHVYDTVVVGAGGSGLRATMAFAENMFFVHLSPLNNTLNDRSMSASH